MLGAGDQLIEPMYELTSESFLVCRESLTHRVRMASISTLPNSAPTTSIAFPLAMVIGHPSDSRMGRTHTPLSFHLSLELTSPFFLLSVFPPTL